MARCDLAVGPGPLRDHGAARAGSALYEAAGGANGVVRLQPRKLPVIKEAAEDERPEALLLLLIPTFDSAFGFWIADLGAVFVSAGLE